MIQMQATYSPFKFLDAYEAGDRQEFFGRDQEIAQLYERVYESDLVLLYGTSGTGKTSLINCGLANEFDATDWLPIFVYREARKLSQSLGIAIAAEAKKIGKDFSHLNSLSEQLAQLSRLHFKPIYLIFDQFEELFVIGDEAEQLAFFESLAEIQEEAASVKVLISMREEYLGHLYPFEAILPGLFNRRLRIESMSSLQAGEVILRSCESFNIQLEDPETNAAKIIEQVQSGSGTEISLPYLQVYLDQFYREDLLRTYPQGIPTERYPALEFTSKEIETFGKISDILQNFLREQERSIQTAAQHKFPQISSQAVKKVLGQFVSLDGTKIPIHREELNIGALKEEELNFILEELEKARILRPSDQVLSLIHDSLAARIAGQRNADEVALIRTVELVQKRSKDFQHTQTWLSPRELSLIEHVEAVLQEEDRLTREEWNFIDNSRKDARRRRRNRWLLVMAAFAVLLSFLALIYLQLQNTAAAKDEAQAALLDSYLERQESLQLKLMSNRDIMETLDRAGEDRGSYQIVADSLGQDSIHLSQDIQQLSQELKSFHEEKREELQAQLPGISSPQTLDSLQQEIQKLEEKIGHANN